jgi:hypothetical protein
MNEQKRISVITRTKNFDFAQFSICMNALTVETIKKIDRNERIGWTEKELNEKFGKFNPSIKQNYLKIWSEAQ